MPCGNLLEKYNFAILTIFLYLINLPSFHPHFVPMHDSMFNFEMFYYFYNEFFCNHQVAQWIPHYNFGFPAHYFYLYILTPFSYFAMLLGKIFHVTNVLSLFKMSLLLEQMIFLSGMWLLSRTLFKNRATVFIIGLASVCGMGWASFQYQLYFDFRIFYLFPLASYFLVLFFETKQLKHLCLTGITVLFWTMGNAQYFVVLWMFLLFSVFAGCLNANRDILRHRFQVTRQDVLFLSILMILAGSYFYLLKDTQEHSILLSRSQSGDNSLSQFLNYGRALDFGTLLSWFIFEQNYQVYVGLLPLIFFVWSLWRVRHPYNLAFLSAAILSLLIFCGGIFAAGVYLFPGMAYYRHIHYIQGLIKVLILICAGFGLDDYWSTPSKTRIQFIEIGFLTLILLLDVFGISALTTKILGANPSHGGNLHELSPPTDALRNPVDIIHIKLKLALYAFVIVAFALIGRGIPRVRFHQKWISVAEKSFMAALVLVFCADILLFQIHQYSHVTLKLPVPYRDYAYVFHVHNPDYQFQRRLEPEAGRAKDIFAVKDYFRRQTKYATAYSFAQFDPCFSNYRADFMLKGMARLYALKGQIDEDFLAVVGCHASKIKLFPTAAHFTTRDQAEEHMASVSTLSDHLILSGTNDPPEPLKGKGGLNHEERNYAIVKEFSANEIIIQANIHSEKGAWLFYADAFHPGWKAFINDKGMPIYEAYGAFKAVPLPDGKSLIRFTFHNNLASILNYVLIATSLVFGSILVGIFLKLLLDSDHKVYVGGV